MLLLSDCKFFISSPLVSNIQELSLLKQFDANDAALSAKREKQHKDKKEVVSAISACNAKLAAKQSEAEVLCNMVIPPSTH